jgi:hypothetical protein
LGWSKIAFESDTLDYAGPVAKNYELKSSAASFVVDPTTKSHFSAFMRPNVCDVHYRHEYPFLF